MQDFDIVELYWARSQDAVTQTDIKYGRMLYNVSFSVLGSKQDGEECVNDTYLTAWNKMPTDRPTYLGAYLTKIIRAVSIDRYRANHAEKRGGAQAAASELTECIPSEFSVEGELEAGMLRQMLDSFLQGLDKEKRVIFVKRYFYCESVAEIAKSLDIGESKIKVTLYRLRVKLKEALEKEGLM